MGDGKRRLEQEQAFLRRERRDPALLGTLDDRGKIGLRVGVLSKAELELATTRWAQGGVAAALSGDPEEIDLHLADTLAAGAGLCDPDAVYSIVADGYRAVTELVGAGARFDESVPGQWALNRWRIWTENLKMYAKGTLTSSFLPSVTFLVVSGRQMVA